MWNSLSHGLSIFQEGKYGGKLETNVDSNKVFILFLPLDILHFNNWIKIELLLTINVLMVIHLSSI